MDTNTAGQGDWLKVAVLNQAMVGLRPADFEFRIWRRGKLFLNEPLERILKYRLGRGHLGLGSRLQAVPALGRLKAGLLTEF